MIYPKYLQVGNTIGICAPSDGITNPVKIKRMNNSIDNLTNQGFKVIESDSVRKSQLGKSNTALIRAQELEEMYLNKDVNMIICATGGDFLYEIFTHINFNIIKDNIKWLQGYSDPTGLLFYITTTLDIATIYGYNIGTYGMNKWHNSITDNINTLMGKIDIQYNYDYYENNFYDYVIGDEEFHKDLPVVWKNLNDEKEITIKGRIIGGCLDVILDFLGTEYDNTLAFLDKYKDDGFIWYFDNCELSSESLMRALWKLNNCGWFKYTKGIVFGRSLTEKSFYNIGLKDALKLALNELNIPVIYDVDIGHKHPSLTIINGSLATIYSYNGKGYIKQTLS